MCIDFSERVEEKEKDRMKETQDWLPPAGAEPATEVHVLDQNQTWDPQAPD